MGQKFKMIAGIISFFSAQLIHLRYDLQIEAVLRLHDQMLNYGDGTEKFLEHVIVARNHKAAGKTHGQMLSDLVSL